MRRNVPLTPEGRLRPYQRVEAGRPGPWRMPRDPSDARTTGRMCRGAVTAMTGKPASSTGPAGARRSSANTAATIEQRIVAVRTKQGLGPSRIAGSWAAQRPRSIGR
jgi:hypothetical protein